MPNKTKRGPSNTNYYKTAESRRQKNKDRKLEKHLKKHPNDRQSVSNLGKPVDYTKKS